MKERMFYRVMKLLPGMLFILTILPYNSAYSAGGFVTVKGSDTMVHLMSAFSEEYMNKNKGMEVSVTGGGSGVGIAAILNGSAEIAASSRELQPKEFALAKQKNIELTATPVALDGIAIIVNSANPVKELSLEQIKKIYTGKYTNWKQAGGPDQPIMVLSRDTSSGTYVYFQEEVLQKEDYYVKTRLMPATSAIVQSVAEDKWSIGYVGIGYAEQAGAKIKVLPVKKEENQKGIEPTTANIKSKKYPISRELFIITNSKKLTENGKKFIDFMTGPEGQKLVPKTGYVSIK